MGNLPTWSVPAAESGAIVARNARRQTGPHTKGSAGWSPPDERRDGSGSDPGSKREGPHPGATHCSVWTLASVGRRQNTSVPGAGNRDTVPSLVNKRTGIFMTTTADNLVAPATGTPKESLVPP